MKGTGAGKLGLTVVAAARSVAEHGRETTKWGMDRYLNLVDENAR